MCWWYTFQLCAHYGLEYWGRETVGSFSVFDVWGTEDLEIMFLAMENKEANQRASWGKNQ